MSTPRIDSIETSVSGLSTSLQSSVVNLTYRTATTATGAPASGVFHSTVVGRAPIVDFSNDLRPRMGIERVMTQALMEVQGESGASGERVLKPINDTMDAARFVGGWVSFNTSNGPFISCNGGDYFEVTFYGTGLNVLVYVDGTARNMSVSVDGGSASTVNNSGSAILQTRNYASNIAINLVSGLALGVHTVKVAAITNATNMFGYEVLNEASTIKTAPGTASVNGKLLTLSALDSQAYNTTFDAQYQNGGTSPSDLTRGGRVVMYQKTDGTIGKSITWTNTAAAYLTSANHANESVIRTYHWREFGCGRNTANAGQAFDDFSSLTPSAASDRAFTLDDGTTTLVGKSVVTSTTETCAIATDNIGFLTFTFVGTGLDMTWVTGATGTNSSANAFEVFINGSSVGNWDTAAVSGVYTKKKIVSGLPYGTHIVKIQRNTANVWSLTIKDFIIYGPAKPALPSGAIELADYYLMADFAANTTVGLETIARGVLRKSSMREHVYVNGTGGTVDWGVTLAVTSLVGGWGTATDRQNAFWEYTFFGTGFEQRFQSGTNRSANIQVSLQSLSTGGSLQNLTTTNFPSISGNNSTYGTGVVFTPSTGIFDQLDASPQNGAGLRISNLPLALYKVRFLNNTASSYIVTDTFDIITPIHVPKNNTSGVIQNTLSVGSCALSDNRQFNTQQIPAQKAWSQAVGVTSNTTTTSTTVTVPLPDLSCVIKTSGNPIAVSYSANIVNNNSGAEVEMQLFLNGVSVPNSSATFTQTSTTVSQRTTTGTSVIIPVAAGTHKLDVYWIVSSGTATALVTRRNLTAREL